MTDTPTLFSPATPLTTLDPSVDYFSELVGEGKKFATEADLARAKMESDLHIARLEAEKRELKKDFDRIYDDLSARARLEEIADRISQVQQTSNDGQPDANVQQQNNQPILDPSKIEELVQNTIRQAEETRSRQRNLDTVQNKFREKYGDNFGQILKEQTKQLGLTEKGVEDLAATAPEAVFKIFGLDNVSDSRGGQIAPPRTSINSGSFKPRTTKKTASYYEEMRKSDPKKFWDPKTQLERMNSAAELGLEEFNDIP